MKNIITSSIAICALQFSAIAQPILAGGFGTAGLGVVNGTTYTKTGTLGTGDFPFVSASLDGTKFFASAPSAARLYYVNVGSMSFSDSMNLFVRNLASSNEANILFATTKTSLVKIDIAAKSVIDSIVLGVPWLPEERPNAKEVWVTDSGRIHVVDYSGTMSFTNINVSSSPYDYGGVRFTPGGTVCYKGCSNAHKIFKINATTKVLVDSVATTYSPGAVVVSHDSAKLFVTDVSNSRIKIYTTTPFVLVDSIDCGTREPMNIYRHPTRNEIWAINHFKDSASVYNESTKALIAAFGIAGSPWYIAFSTGVTGLPGIANEAPNVAVFPNPSGHSVTLTIGEGEQYDVVLTDVTGRTVLSRTASTTYPSFNVASLSPGTYYFTLLRDGKRMHTISWVKQ